MNLLNEKTIAHAVDFKLKNFGGTDADLSSVMGMIEWAIDLALSFAGILGIIMILYSGFLYVSSFGKEEQAETAKKTLLWSIIGTFVVILAKVIVDNLDRFLS
jgi:hypothetical protein